MLWDATAPPHAAKRLVESLETHFPSPAASSFAVAMSPGMACFHFLVEFSAYSRATLTQVESAVKESGGRFIELLRIPEDKRDAFKAQFLMPPQGEPLAFSDFKGSAQAIQEHLRKLSSPQSSSPVLNQAAPASSSTGAEMRKTRRFNVNLEVEFQSEADFAREHATNISKGGVFVRTTQRPALNSELGLKLRLPNGQVIETTARVVHVLDHPQAGGVGLAFNMDDPVFAKNLESYLAALEKN